MWIFYITFLLTICKIFSAQQLNVGQEITVLEEMELTQNVTEEHLEDHERQLAIALETFTSIRSDVSTEFRKLSSTIDSMKIGQNYMNNQLATSLVTFTSIRADVASVFEKMVTIESMQYATKEDLAEHNRQLTNEFGKLSSTVDSMKIGQNFMNNQLATALETFTSIRADVATVFEKMVTIESTQNATKEDLAELNRQLTNVFEKMVSTESTQNTMKEDLTEHNRQLTNEFEKLSSTVGTMEDVITQMNNQLTTILEKMVTSESTQNAIQEDLAQHRKLTNENSPCVEGWSLFNDSCYRFADEWMTWADASQKCNELHSFLVEVTSEAEHDFVGDNMKDDSWIGLTDREEEGVFRWTNDQSTLDSNISWWGEGQPSNKDERLDCVAYWKVSRRWHTHFCSSSSSSLFVRKFYYVCEKPL